MSLKKNIVAVALIAVAGALLSFPLMGVAGMLVVGWNPFSPIFFLSLIGGAIAVAAGLKRFWQEGGRWSMPLLLIPFLAGLQLPSAAPYILENYSWEALSMRYAKGSCGPKVQESIKVLGFSDEHQDGDDFIKVKIDAEVASPLQIRVDTWPTDQRANGAIFPARLHSSDRIGAGRQVIELRLAYRNPPRPFDGPFVFNNLSVEAKSDSCASPVRIVLVPQITTQAYSYASFQKRHQP